MKWKNIFSEKVILLLLFWAVFMVYPKSKSFGEFIILFAITAPFLLGFWLLGSFVWRRLTASSKEPPSDDPK